MTPPPVDEDGLSPFGPGLPAFPEPTLLPAPQRGGGGSLGFKVIRWVKASELWQAIALGIAMASDNTRKWTNTSRRTSICAITFGAHSCTCIHVPILEMRELKLSGGGHLERPPKPKGSGQTGCGAASVPSPMACLSQAPGSGPVGRLSGCQDPGSGDEAVMELHPRPAVPRASNCWELANSKDRTVIADLAECPVPLGVVFFHCN